MSKARETSEKLRKVNELGVSAKSFAMGAIELMEEQATGDDLNNMVFKDSKNDDKFYDMIEKLQKQLSDMKKFLKKNK